MEPYQIDHEQGGAWAVVLVPPSGERHIVHETMDGLAAAGLCTHLNSAFGFGVVYGRANPAGPRISVPGGEP